MAAVYKKMYGGFLSEIERRISVEMGICTPLVDDFTDEKSLSNEDLDLFVASPADYLPRSMEEDITRKVFLFALENVHNPEGLLHSAKQVIRAQYGSQRQMEKGTDRNELLKITLDKGGWSVIFYHYLIEERPDNETLEMLYKMGGILQICNDIFDVYKDHNEGIETHANTCDDFSGLEAYFIRECRAFVKMARALNVKKTNREFFITFFVMGMARGIVALRMLNVLQKGLGGGILPIGQLEKKQLICDMEKPANLLKMIWFAYRLQSKTS